ncbi:MAG: helix-turn-helix domain-containing protein [Alteromonadaceae bacterium]|nr:helix-turn-helix domain-containing protein [Alteromonadaceae bacterium]
MSHTYFIRTSSLHGLDQQIESVGGNLSEVLHRFGLAESSLTSEFERIDVQVLVALLNHSATTFDCPGFALQLGSRQNLTMLGALGALIANCATARDAKKVVSAFMAYHNQTEYWDWQEYQDIVVVQRFDNFYEVSDSRQYHELALSACFHLLRAFLGSYFKPIRVEMSHSPLSEKRSYNAHFGVETRFNQERDAIVMQGGFMDLPIRQEKVGTRQTHDLAKQTTRHYLESLRGQFQDDIVGQVATLLQQTMGSNESSIDNIAQLLHLNRRTLQRKLQAKGVIFRELFNETRHKKAKWYLTSSRMDITLMSSVLGYNDVSNFSRAFKKIEGISPQKWRHKTVSP